MKYSTEENRINLNDLLRRVEERKKQENKVNIIVIGTAFILAMVVLLMIVF